MHQLQRFVLPEGQSCEEVKLIVKTKARKLSAEQEGIQDFPEETLVGTWCDICDDILIEKETWWIE